MRSGSRIFGVLCVLTVLSAVLSTQDGQSFTDRRPNHEGISGTQAILIRLSQSEFLKVQTQLAHIWLLFNRDLTCVGSVLSSRIRRIHEDSLVLIRDAATREFEGTTGTKSIGTGTN